MSQPPRVHAFLSYCRDDKAQVRIFRHELIQHGIKPWWDDDILPGQDWKAEIKKALSLAYAVLICLSRNLTAREQSGLYPELLDAIEILRKMRPGSVFVIPVRLSDCEIPTVDIDATRTLDSLQRVDLFPDSERVQQLEKLVKVLREKAGTDGHLLEPASGPKTRVTITIDVEYESFDKRSQNTLRHGLAGFLDIDSDHISIIAIEEGSVKVTIDMPERAARRLMLLRNEPGLALALQGIPIVSIEIAGRQAKRQGIPAKVGRHRVGMDGRWGLETLGSFSRLYFQVYSVLYALNVEHTDRLEHSVKNVFQSYPWRGGFSRLNFYNSVKSLVPLSLRPDIHSIQYASPGEMILNLVPEVGDLITISAQQLLDESESAFTAYRAIDKEMGEQGLRTTHVRGRSQDEGGEIAVQGLTDAQLAFVQRAFSDLARELKFTGAERLSELTGNRLAALKILMSYFRRIRELVTLVRQDLIEL